MRPSVTVMTGTVKRLFISQTTLHWETGLQSYSHGDNARLLAAVMHTQRDFFHQRRTNDSAKLFKDKAAPLLPEKYLLVVCPWHLQHRGWHPLSDSPGGRCLSGSKRWYAKEGMKIWELISVEAGSTEARQQNNECGNANTTKQLHRVMPIFSPARPKENIL